MDSHDKSKSSTKTNKSKKKRKLNTNPNNSSHSSSESDDYSDAVSSIEEVTWLADEIVEKPDSSQLMLELLKNINTADQDSNLSSSEESYVYFEMPKMKEKPKNNKENIVAKTKVIIIFLRFLSILTFIAAEYNA